MRRSSVFLVIALITVSAVYVLLARDRLPRPGSAAGLLLASAGFLLMLATETIYSLRKRLRSFTRGRMATWLQLHIFTGIVGSYLVLLHSTGRFHGVAGLAALLTVTIVASGLVGRYLYTSVPRTIDGVEVAVADLGRMIDQADEQLRALGIEHLGTAALAIAREDPPRGLRSLFGGSLRRRKHRRRLRRALQPMSALGRVHDTVCNYAALR